MKYLRPYLGILIAGVLLFFLINPFVQARTQLAAVTFQWQWVILSFLLILFYWSVYVFPFATLLSGTTHTNVSFGTAFTLFHRANITRYLPGRIWGIVRLLTLSEQFGFRKTAVGASLTLHVGIETALGGLISLILIFSEQMRSRAYQVFENISGNVVLSLFLGMFLVTGGLLLIPKVTATAQSLLKGLRQIGTPLLPRRFWQQWLYILYVHILLWGCQTFAFFLFVRSFVPIPWEHIGILSGCYSFAWIVGFLSFLFPGGLGVREGLLSLLLASYMPISQATLIALLCRGWILTAEMFLAGIAFLINKRDNDK